MNIILERTEPKQGDTHRFGTLKANGFSCKTLEWPEVGGAHKCLPSGKYNLVLGMHYGENQLSPPYACYHIYNEAIPLTREFEIHIGNWLRNSKGCILLGTTEGILEEEKAILHSKIAFDEFMNVMNGAKEATLVILYPSTGPNLDT